MKNCLVIFSIFLLCLGLHSQTWTPLSVGVATEVFHLSFPSNDTGFASLGNGTMRKTVDGGGTWTNVSLPGVYGGAVEFISGNIGMIGTDSGIVRTTNCGASWNLVYSASGLFWNDITFVNSTNGFAAAVGMSFDTFFVFKTLDAGLTWTPCTPIHDWLASTPYLHFRTTSEGYLYGSDTIYRTTDAGITWSRVFASNNNAQITALCAADANTTYACDIDIFSVSKSTNGGVTWSPTGQSMASITYSAHFINANFGFMCGGNGINAGFISQTIDGGVSWTSPVIDPTTYLSMDFPSSSTGYCGGTAGVIMKYAGPTSVELETERELKVYPNPANDLVTIENAPIGSTIEMLNTVGVVVRVVSVQRESTSINISDLPAGIYYLNSNSDNKFAIRRIVKM